MRILKIAIIIVMFVALLPQYVMSQGVENEPVALDADSFGVKDGLSVDTLTTVDEVVPDSVPKKRNIVQKFFDYFKYANKPRKPKKFDISFIGGPHYSSDTQLGLGLVASGFYRKDLADTITMPSNVSLYGDISTVGFYLIGIRGNHIFTNNKRRIDYTLYFYSFPRRFWGVGFNDGIDINHQTKMNQKYIRASVDYLWRIGKSFYVGPAAEFVYCNASKIDSIEIFRDKHGRDLERHTSTYAVGFGLQYDTRDNLTATQKGWHISFEQRFAPKFLGNKLAFSYSELGISAFQPVWKGGVLAERFHFKANYGNVPWALLATLGGSNNMRGYYDGRFRDKAEMDLTVELRQHVWRRNGVVVWGGVGSVFSKFNEVWMKRMLPCAGVGYRWEFKKLSNVRLDLGFGRGEYAFVFSINEAF